jgi:Caspase domain
MDRSGIAARMLGLIALMWAVGTAVASAQTADPRVTCHLTPSRTGAARGLQVALDKPTTPIRTGDPVRVTWKAAAAVDASCRNPLYLVVTTQRKTRFEGNKILALLAGTDGPFGMKYGRDRTRVLIPLHLGKDQHEGTVSVKFYEEGQPALEWALVEVAALRQNPQTRSDLAMGAEVVHGPFTSASDFRVVSGNPRIVVRDRFTVERPKQVVLSNSGEFELQIFDKYYRVLDRKSGELVLERSGLDPNFSNSSRFLGAFSDGAGFEVWDLYAGKVIVSSAALRREAGFAGSAHLAAWSANDSFLAISFWGWGGVQLEQSLVDRGGRSFPVMSCHACQAWNDSNLIVDLEFGIVALSGSLDAFRWESLLNTNIGTAAAEAIAAARITPKSKDDTSVSEKREKFTKTLSDGQFDTLSRASFISGDAIRKDAIKEKKTWRLAGPISLSHHCVWNEKGQCGSHTGDDAAWRKEQVALKALRIQHRGAQAAAEPAKGLTSAETRLLEGRDVERRGNAKAVAANQLTLWGRLAQLEPSLSVGDAQSVPVQQISWEVASNKPDDVIRPILMSIPAAVDVFKVPDDMDGWDNDKRSGMLNEATLIQPKEIRSLANWQVAGTPYWLIHPYFSMGASSRYWLFLLRGGKSGGYKLVDLSARLKYKVGSKPSGLGSDGQIETTDERGSTMGFGGWPSDVDKIRVAHGRFLVLSGHWTGASLRWALVYDFSDDRIVYFDRDVPQAHNVNDYAVTRDGRLLVQSNQNGELYFFETASGKLRLRGFDIDQELVLYDPFGYYKATPEGSHFLFLKFPGRPGYSSFKQFSKQLNRPDIIESLFAGKAQAADPALTPPPTLVMTSTVSGSGPQQRSVNMRLSAYSVVGLKSIRVFVDGAPAGEIGVKGNQAESEKVLQLPSNARWVTAVAVDMAGIESVPQGVGLEASKAVPQGRLLAITVGTDVYDEKLMTPLKWAKSDALRFEKAINDAQGKYYATVSVTPFLDANGLAKSLPDKIRELSAVATERDTIMLFVAGHGYQHKASGKFYLATRDMKLDLTNAISWDVLAKAFEGARARIVVFLDACHSGATGGTNDDAVSSLLRAQAPLTVIAAAKGRQDSIGLGSLGGGVFTRFLVKAIAESRRETDVNSNGAIELAELYGALKRQVLETTNGQQTPWIARDQMVGEIPLF